MVFNVSVPLRGCSFEILLLESGLRQKLIKFPSPCGDVVLKYMIL